MTDFKCAWESKNGPDAKRCTEQCESCRIWWTEPITDINVAKDLVADLIKTVWYSDSPPPEGSGYAWWPPREGDMR